MFVSGFGTPTSAGLTVPTRISNVQPIGIYCANGVPETSKLLIEEFWLNTRTTENMLIHFMDPHLRFEANNVGKLNL